MNNNNSRKWFCQLSGLDSMECGLKPTEFFSHHFPLNFSVEKFSIYSLLSSHMALFCHSHKNKEADLFNKHIIPFQSNFKTPNSIHASNLSLSSAWTASGLELRTEGGVERGVGFFTGPTPGPYFWAAALGSCSVGPQRRGQGEVLF